MSSSWRKEQEREGAGTSRPRGSSSRPSVEPLPNRIFAALDRQRFVPVTLLFGTALIAGALIAPELGGHQYPTSSELSGTVSEVSIKAPYDIAVPDEEKTFQRREAAALEVGRVYDYDVGVHAGGIKRIQQAFTEARRSPEPGEEEGGPEEGAFTRRAARFGETLKISLSDADLAWLEEVGYAQSLEEGVLELFDRFQKQEIVESPGSLIQDTQRGITVQPVPDHSSAPRSVKDLSVIANLPSIQSQIRREGASLTLDSSGAPLKIALVVAASLVRPNLTVNIAQTELARDLARIGVATEHLLVKRGEMIVRDGERISSRHLLIFNALNLSRRNTDLWLVVLGASLLVLLLVFTGFGASTGQRWRSSLKARELLFLSTTFLLAVGACRLWLMVALAILDRYPAIPLEALIYGMPIATGAMVVKLVLRMEPAILFGMLVSLVGGILLNDHSWFAAYGFVGGILGATLLRTVNARGDILRAGIWAGVGQGLFVTAVLFFKGGGEVSPFLIGVAAAFLGGVLSGFITLALTPVVEFVFRYTSDLKLLELANLNHPALKELIVQAPGSYHHSIVVGSLAEAAAEVVGANPLLARVMAYYHDLGKGCNAPYFIENQRLGNNPHDRLNPSMSAMILRRHVTDGLEIAKRYGLGEVILAAIAEHHGTTRIQYFYHKHKENESKYGPVSEQEYRYPGRKPQTRESALVMIADSIEAAARALANPTPARLQGLVNRIINVKFTDGQLDECDLTLRDLHIIAKAFMRVLNSIYHQRVEYPEIDTPPERKKEPLKRDHGHSDSKPTKTASDPHHSVEEDRPDNLRRLGL